MGSIRRMSKRGKAARDRPISRQVDKYELYQTAVQCPDAEPGFFSRAYRDAYGETPALLREDFCGTGAVSCAWVGSRSDRVAYGVDLDPQPLAWGQRNNLSRLRPRQQERVHLTQGDVRTAKTPAADVLCAQNFSFFTFKTRPEVVSYFATARANLAARGVFVLDVFGGSEVQLEDREDTRRYNGFTYVWDQHRFDPITHHCTFFIHFRFRDGSELRRAFRYDWRLWSIPEIREMLEEAGFRASKVYWEGTEQETGEGNGVYRARPTAPADPAWVCYVVGVK